MQILKVVSHRISDASVVEYGLDESVQVNKITTIYICVIVIVIVNNMCDSSF